MKSLWDYVSSVQSKKASSIRFAPHRPVEYCVGRSWTPHPWDLGKSDAQDLLTPHLSTEERRRLDAEKSLSGILSRPSLNIRYQIFKTPEGLSGTVHWLNEGVSLEEWDLPPFFIEKIQKQSGFSLVYGPPRSGKTTLSSLLARAISLGSRRAIYFSDEGELEIPGVPCLQSNHLLRLQNPGLSGEVIFVDSHSSEVQRRAFDLAVEGATIVSVIPANGIGATFYLWLERMKLDGSQVWPLVAENFVSALGLRLASGVSTAYQPVFELLLSNKETKSLLSSGTVHGLVEVMSKGGDKSGMRTMNQALLQLLLKRKIELRVGFEESSDPVELDGLLKKVGI